MSNQKKTTATKPTIDSVNLAWARQSQKILDAINVGYVLVDMNDYILEVNESTLTLGDYTREELIGKHASLVFATEEEYEEMHAMDLELMKTKDSYQYEYFLYSKSGEKIPALFNIFINRDSDGNATSQNVMLTDIRETISRETELREAYEQIQTNKNELSEANLELQIRQVALVNEKKKLESVLYGFEDSVTVFDMDGQLLFSNPMGLKIHEKSNEPLFPLQPGASKRHTIKSGRKTRHFEGTIKEIADDKGDVFAFAEILKDVTDQIRIRKQQKELVRIRKQVKREQAQAKMVGISPEMRNLFDAMARLADVDSSILILGETGVGKEMVARNIHDQSRRYNHNFVAINCGALPEMLIESELFGHVKGAFSGAISDHPGLFREADKGTLFLDEIGELPPTLQVKLLRALQEKEVRPVGSNKSYPVDARLICATNKDLQQMIADGVFRQDLYYRIAVIPVTIPPLRERKQDILPLAGMFTKKHARDPEVHYTIDHEVQQLLLDYHWPGNIRELENCIEHTVAMMSDTVITPRDLPVHIFSEPPKPSTVTVPGVSTTAAVLPGMADLVSNQSQSPLSIRDSEKTAILDALKRREFNQTQAARDLGIARVTLWRKIKKYSLM